jgi:hypothetical protein
MSYPRISKKKQERFKDSRKKLYRPAGSDIIL